MYYYYQPISNTDVSIKRVYRVLPDGTVQYYTSYSAWQPLLFPACFYNHIKKGIIKELEADVALQYEAQHSVWRTA